MNTFHSKIIISLLTITTVALSIVLIVTFNEPQETITETIIEYLDVTSNLVEDKEDALGESFNVLSRTGSYAFAYHEVFNGDKNTSIVSFAGLNAKSGIVVPSFSFSEEDTGKRLSPYFNPRIDESSLYFVADNAVQVVDLETSAVGFIDIPVATEVALARYFEANPDADPDEAVNVPFESEIISDIIFSEDEIVFLGGECAEGSDCYLGVYDRKTMNSRLISSNLNAQMSAGRFSLIRLQDYSAATSKIVLRHSEGDGCCGSGSIYSVTNVSIEGRLDMEGSKIILIDSASTNGACDAEESPDKVAECERENERYDSLFSDKELACGSLTFQAGYESGEGRGVYATWPDGAEQFIEGYELISCYE